MTPPSNKKSKIKPCIKNKRRGHRGTLVPLLGFPTWFP